MLQQTYQFTLNYDIQPQLCITGKLFQDVPTSVLVCVTNIGKVLIYTPRGQVIGKEQINAQFLNISKKIQSITLCKFISETSPSDKLILASQNTLIVYDVEKNLDLFYKEVPDGIYAVCFGDLNISSQQQKSRQLTFTGGNCQILGFDQAGDESYWNVTSDQVTALCPVASTNDAPPYLIVGSSDSSVRIYQSEEIVYELQVASSPIVIVEINNSEDGLIYALGLENGFVGAYKNHLNMWIIKESIKPLSLILSKWESDLQDNSRPLLVGRFDGSIEIRRDNNGELLYKHQSYGINLSTLLYDDLNGSLRKQIIAIYQDGSVRGFTLAAQEKEQNQIIDQQKYNEIYESLNAKKLELIQKIAGLSTAIQGVGYSSLLPKNTQVQMGFSFGRSQHLELIVKTNEESTSIRQVILQADSLFLPYTNFVFTPKKPNHMISIPLNMIKENKQIELKARVLVGQSQSGQSMQVFETRNNIPKFAQFCYTGKPTQSLPSFLKATIKERIPRFIKWLDQCFIFEEKELKSLETKESLSLAFKNISTQEFLQFHVDPSIGMVQVNCESIDLAGEIIQDLCNFMHLHELYSEGDFPLAMNQLRKAIEKVELLNQAKHLLNADVAESVQIIKANIVRAEDARFVQEWAFMRKVYASVMVENKKLQAELLKKNQNNEILMDSLREINAMIAKGSNLRVGRAKEQITQMCRNAVKKKNLQSLISILQQGKETL